MEFVSDIKRNLSGKRLLILGGGLWKDAIQKVAEEYNITLIAAGSDQSSYIFEIAKEKYNVDSTDCDEMKKLIVDKKIDGVYMGGSETVISSACVYLNELKFPCYCTKEQWNSLQDKSEFKTLCVKHGLPVVERFDVSEQNIHIPIEFPVVTKPVDGSGSSGFSVCYNIKELRDGYKRAKKVSPTGNVIVEKYVKNDAVVVFYTVVKGKLYFSGLEDKYPVKYEKQGSYVGGLFMFESKLASEFRLKFEDKINTLISDVGIVEGNFWIEIFVDKDNYYFNEAGFRYGGSASLYPIDYMYGINQVAIDIYYALTGKSSAKGFISIIPYWFPKKKYYAIYPVYARGGSVEKIVGVGDIEKNRQVLTILLRKKCGDFVMESGTFSQVVALVHFVFDNKSELMTLIDNVHDKLEILNQNGENMIFRMLDAKKVRLR